MDKDELVRRLVAPRFDAEPLARFLCAHHGVADVSQIVPFGQRRYGWDVCRETVLPIEVRASGSDVTVTPLGSPQPRDPFCHPVSGQPMPVDLQRIHIYSLACRSYSNSTGIPWTVRLNFYNEPMAELQETRMHDAIYAEAGLKEARGAFSVLLPTAPGESKDMSEVPIIETQFAYQNSHFVRTMALINETNIMNGLVQIPHEVCVAARLPVWLGEDKAFLPSEQMISGVLRAMGATQESAPAMRAHYVANYQREMLEKWKGKQLSHHFIAMPINHVLAWPLHSESFRAAGDQQVEEFRFSAQGVNPLLYYLVPETLFQHNLQCWRKSWMGKVDTRPLSSVGFEFTPMAKASAPNGTITLRAHMTYFAAPELSAATIAALAPALSLGFPSCHMWSHEDMERDAAVRALREGNQ
jgi:hypothetical protein